MRKDKPQVAGSKPNGNAPESDRPQNDLAEAAKRAVAPAPLRKRFYELVDVDSRAAHWFVLLDGRGLRTPGKRELALPNEALAEEIAAEWQAQKDEINPITMPLTRLANSAIDGIAGREAEVRADIVDYAGSDALCYRAERPEVLVARQRAQWDPILDWANETLHARFTVASGIMPVKQPEQALAAIDAVLAGYDAMALAALHVMTTLTGSALLMLAHARGFLSVEEAWRAAHVDEDHQIGTWGEDAEARTRRQGRRQEMIAASRLLTLLA